MSSSRTLRIAAVSLNQTPLDWDNNLANILDAFKAARDIGAELVCLPELSITGYGCEDMFLYENTELLAWNNLQIIAQASTGIVAAVGLPIKIELDLYNCVALVANGKLLGLTAKKHLCADGVHYEPRWFKAWPEGAMETLERDSLSLPFGDVWYEIDGVKVGFEICHDAWVVPRHGIVLKNRGVDLILNPSASHFALKKRSVVEALCKEGSRSCAPIYCFANLLGCEAGRTIYGGDRILAVQGEVVGSGERFTYEDLAITSMSVELPQTIAATAAYDLPPVVVSGQFRFCIDSKKADIPKKSYSWESESPIKLRDQNVPTVALEEFTRSLSLALFDYMRRSKTRGFVISLSGGADSTSAAVLVTIMANRIWNELGKLALIKKLDYWPAIADLSSEAELRKLLLTCVYQKAAGSTEKTHTAARTIAEAIGANFIYFDTSPIVNSYSEMVEKGVQHRFSWEKDDLTLQNIQARARGPGVWMVANLKGALLLSTANRSEAAVGYTTMDGDTCGGLSPLGGIDKAFIRRWLVWMETVGSSTFPKIPELNLVNVLAPTAELRPGATPQTDEGDLMPYDVLDRIERLAIASRLSPLKIFKSVATEFDGIYSHAQIAAWVEKFFRLWSSTQWKRERYAPSFHLDEESLDPRGWMRFPILSGGFKMELEELRSYIALK